MPNWCMNKLTVSGNAAELKRFVESSMRSFQRLRKSWRRVILRITNSLRTLCCTH